MRVVFRADASTSLGTGHVTRCATLGAALRERGAQVSFVCREHPGNLIHALRERAFPVGVLPAPAAAASELADADETIAALEGEQPDWLVVDHYALGGVWERHLRPHARRLLVIDDLADRAHDCDLLLDQNFVADGEHRHDSLVGRECRQLLGPRYALLAPEYASYRQTGRSRDGTVRRMLIYFGGADSSNMTALALTAVSGLEFSHLQVDLVIGTNHPQRGALENQAAARPGTHVHGTRPHLADLMDLADLAVGAGGVTTWERLCLGLPSLVLSIAENQRLPCEALAAAGFIQYLGESRTASAPLIRDALARMIEDRDGRAALSSRGQVLVDGRGASRVADIMLGGVVDLVRRRHELHEAGTCPEGFDGFSFAWIDRCQAGDVLALRNMPHVTAQMRSQDPIAAPDHRRFLDAYPRLDRYDFILIDNSRGRCVGAFYVTNLGSSPEIGKYIGDSDYLGKGVAYRATQRLIDFCRSKAGVRHLAAVTRRDNVRNIALNTRLGFSPAGTRDGYLVMAMEL